MKLLPNIVSIILICCIVIAVSPIALLVGLLENGTRLMSGEDEDRLITNDHEKLSRWGA